MSAPSILNMHWSMGLRERLIEDDLRRAMNKEDALQLIEALKWLDPEGWEGWYESNIPDWSDWLKAPIKMLSERVNYLLDLYIGGVDMDAFHDLIVTLNGAPA